VPAAFGTCYTASSIVAFVESVIHGSGRLVGGCYEVPEVQLTERSVVRFICERLKTLVLADMTGAALKSRGLDNDIGASADYAASQAWAQAILRREPTLGWNPVRVTADEQRVRLRLFERSGLRKLRAEKLKARQVDDLCDRFNVTAV
jgi:hypothetical protein